MQKTKRLFAMLMVIAMMLALLPVMASAATPTTLYLKPNSNWTKDGARFAAYFFGNGTTWVSMTDSDGDGYYEVAVPSGYPSVIFCRMDPGTTDNNWNNKWNQTGDLTIPTNGNNCFTVPSGYWDGATTGWGSYTPVVVPEWNSPIVNGDSVTFNYWSSDTLTSVEVRGTINNWTDTAEHHMTQDPETGIWSVTVSGLYNGTYEYKFVTNGSDWINDPKNTGTQIGGNNTFNITEGKVDINEPEYTSPVISGTTVTFNYWQADEFTTATVYGDMSDDGWATAYPMVKNEETGVWSVTVEVPYNGTYEYKIVVDDAWLKDPKNENIADSGNSYFVITEGEEKPIVYPEIVYLLPNFNWGGDYATFAAYFFNADAESVWVSMTDGNVDGVYEAYIPEGMTSVIFCRMNPDASEIGWNTETEIRIWNQSDDIAIPTDGTDLFIMNQGVWGKDTENPWAGAWATYTEVSVPEFESPVIEGNSVTFNYWHYAASSVSVHGTMNEWAEGGYAMTKGENGLWSVTIDNVADAVHQYKFVVDGAWILDPANEETYNEYDAEGNITNQNSKFMIGTPVAEIYDVGVYFTFEDAYAAVDSASGHVIVLLTDVNIDGLAVDKELNLDLNGHNATFTNTTGDQMIWVQDSATVNCETTQWGTLITDANYDCLGGYVMLPEAEGHSFHSYDIQITHISLAPNSDALGYKATVTGDSAVLNAVTGFGFNMSVAGGQVKTFTTEPGENFDGTFTLRLKNILANGGGEMEITASAFVIFGEEQSCDSEQQTTTMKQTLQAVDTAWETAGYTDEQKNAVKALCTEYYDDIQNWGLENIFPVIDIPIS